MSRPPLKTGYSTFGIIAEKTGKCCLDRLWPFQWYIHGTKGDDFCPSLHGCCKAPLDRRQHPKRRVGVLYHQNAVQGSGLLTDGLFVRSANYDD